MGLFEIIGEFFDPGPVGTIDFKDSENNIRQKMIPVRFVVSVVLIGVMEYFIVFHNGMMKEIASIAEFNVALVIYLVLSYFIQVSPEYNNTGWVPFLINNPFRISDNINRFLAFLNILCMPGKFITKSIVGFVSYLTN